MTYKNKDGTWKSFDGMTVPQHAMFARQSNIPDCCAKHWIDLQLFGGAALVKQYAAMTPSKFKYVPCPACCTRAVPNDVVECDFDSDYQAEEVFPRQ